ncbi:MAG: dienelactone hydrolase family protein [Candidatus Odyssella sp.]|nr:dienelactone hydrolase family protein [Candidatus Odyssella sp.]
MQTTTIELANRNGRACQAYLASPDSGRKPAILILSEMFGLNGPMKDFAQHYAARGHCTMVPDLFWRTETPGGLGYDEAGFALAWARIKDFDIDSCAADMRTAAEALRRQPACNGKVVALGFCMGGRLAFVAAARSGVDAAIGLYGLDVSKHLHEVPAIAVPTHLHYGDKDQHVPLAEIEAVARGVAANPNIAIWRYPEAGHSFFNKVRPTYDAAAAALAATRIDAVLAAL